jgi:hypothetical protein
MAILPEQVLAICGLYGPLRRGTAFLVDGNGLLLTAAHLLATAAGDIVPKATYRVRFVGPPVLETTATVVDGELDRIDDWAVLSCAKVPPAVQPFTLRNLSRGAIVNWESFGFPDQHELEGMAIDGVIQGALPKVELRSNQQRGKPGGLSGGPLLVNQQVAGILLESQHEDSPEKLYGVRIDLVASRSKLIGARLPRRKPPHVRDVSQEFQRAGLGDILVEPARKLGVPNPEDLTDKALRLLLAETMLLGGVPASLATLLRLRRYFLELDQDPSGRILELAAQVWIDDDAVALLDRLTRSPNEKVVCLLDAHEATVASWYAHRASCANNDPAPGLYRRSALSANRPSIVTFRRDVIVAVAEALGESEADALAAYEAHIHDIAPILIVVPPPPPSAAALTAVFKEFPRVRFLLMGDDVDQGVLVAAQLPALDPRIEKDAVDELDKAQRRLTPPRSHQFPSIG